MMGNRPLMWTPATADAFKAATAIAAREVVPASETPIRKPVSIWMAFYMPRPKRLCGRRAPSGRIPHDTKPDIDNLQKALIDALVDCGILHDDRIVWSVGAAKFYCEIEDHPRAEVLISCEYGDDSCPE